MFGIRRCYMLDSIRHWLSCAGFTPHETCHLWRADVLSLHVVSAALITLAYFSIPFTLLYFVRQRKALTLQWIFVCFFLFIVACGTTHLMEMVVIWYPLYWGSGGIKVITALASVPTAILLVRLIPQASRLPGPLDMERANSNLGREVVERKRAENEVRRINEALEARVAESTQQLETANRELVHESGERQIVERGLRDSECRLRAVFDSVLSAVIVMNAKGEIIDWNPRAEIMFGWTRAEVLNREVAETIIPVQMRDPHRQGLSHFLTNGESPLLGHFVEMPAVHRGGRDLWVELSISPLKSGEEITFCAFLNDVTERKRSEEAVRASQRMLQAVIDNSTVGIYVKDLEGRYLLANRRYEELFQLTREWIIGKTDFDIFPKEHAEAFRAVDLQVLATGRATQMEEVALHDDEPYTYLSRKCPLQDATGRIYGVCGISTDITQRKRDEELRAQHTEFVEFSNDAIMTKTPQGIITSWNPGAERLFGYSAAEIVGEPMSILFPEERIAEETDILAKIAGGERVGHFDTTRLRKDGTLIDVSVSISPIKNALGGIVGASTIARDISERRRTERELDMHLERLELLGLITRAIGQRRDLPGIFQEVLRSLGEGMPIAFGCICLYDSTAEVLTVASVGVASKAVAADLGLPELAQITIDQNGLARAVRGESVYEPDTAEVASHFLQRLAHAGLHALVATPLLFESTVFGVLIVARRAPYSFSSGEYAFLGQLSAHVALAVYQVEANITLRQAYEDLQHAQQTLIQRERLSALGQMAGGIAHDINNAIAPVALYIESLLESERALSTEGSRYLQVIQRAIDDVATTVKRMGVFYRRRDLPLTMLPIRIDDLVEQVIDLTRARWSDMLQRRDAVIEMRREVKPDLPALMGIGSEMREALVNLIFNAVDAMPDGGILTLRADVTAEGSSVLLEVVDTGVGMDEDTRHRCLEPFFTTKGEHGTGLGMAMVYGMVRRHSGDIEIESAIGRGTTVRLIFHRLTTSLGAPSEVVPAVRVLERLRILVVDDEPLLLNALRNFLEGDGHVVDTANDGREGIDAFDMARRQGEAFDVVISDLGMPSVGGRAVASAIKRRSPMTPVILLTGWGERLATEGDIPPHVDRVLSKPVKRNQLREALATSRQSVGP